jgi:hypothetical protein
MCDSTEYPIGGQIREAKHVVKKLMSLRLICFMLFPSLLVGSQVLFLINDLFWKHLFNVQKPVMSILVKFSFYSSFNSL